VTTELRFGFLSLDCACLNGGWVVQGDFLIEMPVAFRVPSTWVKICATKKMNRFRPPEVAAAVATLDRAQERLQVCPAKQVMQVPCCGNSSVMHA
jgi:hypothetical protein